MQTVPLKLVTIVAEEVLETRLTELLLDLGATGYTVTETHGKGSRGIRTGAVPGTNIRIETVVGAEAADRIVGRLAGDYFANYAVIAWLADVAVVRGEKYLPGPGR